MDCIAQTARAAPANWQTMGMCQIHHASEVQFLRTDQDGSTTPRRDDDGRRAIHHLDYPIRLLRRQLPSLGMSGRCRCYHQLAATEHGFLATRSPIAALPFSVFATTVRRFAERRGSILATPRSSAYVPATQVLAPLLLAYSVIPGAMAAVAVVAVGMPLWYTTVTTVVVNTEQLYQTLARAARGR